MIKKINDRFYKIDTRVSIIGRVIQKFPERIILESDEGITGNKGTRLLLWIRKMDRETGKFLNLEVGASYKINFSITEEIRFDKITLTGFINSATALNKEDPDYIAEKEFSFTDDYAGPIVTIDGEIKRQGETNQPFIISPTDDWGIMASWNEEDEEGNLKEIPEGKIHALGRVRGYIGKNRRLGRIFKIFKVDYVDSKE